jgi:hypothetical protein
VTAAKIKNNAVATAKLADDSVITAKLADDAVTGIKVKEWTLGEVPLATNATKLNGKAPSAYLASAGYRNESPVEAGTTLGDGTQVIAQACNAGDVLLAGGPANRRHDDPAGELPDAWSAELLDRSREQERPDRQLQRRRAVHRSVTAARDAAIARSPARAGLLAARDRL